MGMVSSPALRRRWWATRLGAAWTRQYGGAPDAEPTRLAVTDMARLELATVAIWPTMTSLPEQLRAPTARLTRWSLWMNRAGNRPGARVARPGQ